MTLTSSVKKMRMMQKQYTNYNQFFQTTTQDIEQDVAAVVQEENTHETKRTIVLTEELISEWEKVATSQVRTLSKNSGINCFRTLSRH